MVTVKTVSRVGDGGVCGRRWGVYASGNGSEMLRVLDLASNPSYCDSHAYPSDAACGGKTKTVAYM